MQRSSDLSGFAADLRALWLAAGKPSYRQISRDVQASRGRFYSKSVIGDVLAGRRPPKRDLLVDVVERLGGDPQAWSARLAELLRPAVAAAPAPIAQIPYDIRDFTGREPEVARACALLAAEQATTGLPIVAVQGMAGTGKTRLAIHVAHREKDHFADLQLYADLRGFAAGAEPADPATVLEGFLRQLGVSGPDLPAGLDDRAALYRARLDGRRALVLLDDAAAEDQVRPLLPGCPSCGVLVTSRRALAGLDGAQPLPLGRFAPAESLALLERVVGSERTAAEPEAAQRLVELCAHLPLAVALAARRLRSRPAWRLADLVRRLEREEHRLAELAVSDLAVRAVFELSYAQLDQAHRQLFRRLALHPGRDLDPYAAAALIGAPVEGTTAMLETLLDEHLVEQSVPGRYRQHDLLRVFAAERVATDEDPARRAAALLRLLEWFMQAALRCRQLLAPHRRFMPSWSVGPAAELPGLDTYDQALAWLDVEQPALLAAARLALEHGYDEVAWQLPLMLSPFFETRRAWAPYFEAMLLALKATRRLGDDRAEALVSNELGILATILGDPSAARAYLHRALSIRAELGDEWGVSQVLNNLGELHRRTGDLAGALPYFRQDLEISRRLGDRQGISVTLNNLGKVQYALGHLDQALATLTAALTEASAVHDWHTEAEVAGDRAEVRRALGDLTGAAADQARSARLYDRFGDSVGALTAMLGQAELAVAIGDTGSAARFLRDAAARLDTVPAADATALRRRLTALRRSG